MAESVLLIIDMQTDFAQEEGSLYKPDAEQLIPVQKNLVAQARNHWVPVWYRKNTHTENDPEFEVWGELWVRRSEGWEIMDEL